jgi:RNA-binding protein
MFKELRKRAVNIKPLVRIGKGGITENTITEIKKVLKTKKLIKVKLLPASNLDRKVVAKEIAEKTNSTLVQVIGNNVTLHKN